MNTKLNYLWILLYLIVGKTASYSQNSFVKKQPGELLTFYLLDVEDGLSHNYINSIEQDNTGFIWIATADGINKYNGSRFISFKKNFSNVGNSLLSNHVQQLLLDNHNNILIATDEGLNSFNNTTDQLTEITTNHKFNRSAINCIAIGPNNDLFIGLNRTQKGLYRVNKDDSHSSYSYDPNNQNSLSSNNVSSLAIQGDSILWIGTRDKGLNKLNLKTNTIHRIPYTKTSAIPSVINTLYTDENNNLWIGTNDGIRTITKNSDTISLTADRNINTKLSDAKVLAFESDGLGRMWIGTRNGGLNIVDTFKHLNQANPMVLKFLPKTDGTSVFNRTVSTIKRDRDGNMWLGTSTGVNFVDPRGEPVQLLQRNEANLQTLSHNRIGSLAKSYTGNLWVGTDGGGLDFYNKSNNTIKNYRHEPNDPTSLSNDYIISLFEDSQHRLWAGTYQGGLNKKNPGEIHFTRYLQGPVRNGSDVRVIFEDKNKVIWVGTNRGGLYRYDEKNDRFIYIDMLEKIDIRDITQIKPNELWLATYGEGILKYNYSKNSFENYNSKTVKGFPTDIIFCIESLPNGNLLIGTRYGGLVELEPESKKINVYTEKDGLSNNTISSITLTNDGKAWLGTFNGISNFNIEKHSISSLKNKYNIQQGEFNIGAAVFDTSNLLYFGGNKGLNIINPIELNTNPTSYKIVLENLSVLGEGVVPEIANSKATLSSPLRLTEKIRLKHNQNFLSIGFSLLKYPEAKDISYSYKLENYHNHWIDAKNAGIANLSNIPPGEYLLRLKANNDSLKDITKTLQITITPPFWKTWPAYTLYTLLIAILAFTFVKYFEERIKLKNSLLFEKKQRQLEHDLNEERIRFFTNFSHELKTPLTLILAPLQDLITDLNNKKQLDTLKLIQKNAKYLSRTIHKLLEFRKSEVGLNEFSIGRYNLTKFLNQIVENYRPLAEHRNISLRFENSEKDIMVWFDLEKMQIILNNLLSNAFKFCPDNGIIKVFIRLEQNNFQISVQDNGPGIASEDVNHIFEWYYQSGSGKKTKGSGIGLALCKNYVELHNGQITVFSEHGKGACFTVEIPIDKNRNTFDNTVDLNLNVIKETSASASWGPTEIEDSITKIHGTVDLEKSKELLLLIDDNNDILQYLKSLLQDEYDLIFASNGKIGVEKAFKYIPDLIISDIMMPKKDGIDLCNEIKTNLATTHVPIILLTAKENTESIITSYQEGADDFITKPFMGEILKSRIKNLLENRKKLKKYFIDNESPNSNLNISDSTVLKREKEFIKTLESIILEHLQDNNIKVDSIAKAMGMSRSSLFLKLKAITGRNINEHVRIVRINKAASLIKNDGLTVTQAAYEVGFNSPKYFRKLFKEQFGVLPSKI